jgi:2',3'-cyclic-nucleotide 2'-phosphodiesterase (5'-nucleotidase family)
MLPGESGGFLQVSGISFKIDTSIASSVVTDDKGSFVEVSGARRISDVKVGGVAIEPGGTYTVASHNYMLLLEGDGYAMFSDNNIVVQAVKLDNAILIEYIQDKLGGVVGPEYSEPFGQGRITIE